MVVIRVDIPLQRKVTKCKAFIDIYPYPRIDIILNYPTIQKINIPQKPLRSLLIEHASILLRCY